MTTTVKTTKELKLVFTELSRTDRFKRKLDELFALGYTFDVSYASNFKAFVDKKGTRYKAKIAYKNTYRNWHYILLQKTRITTSLVSKPSLDKFPEKYRNVSENSDGTVRVGNVDENLYNAEHEIDNSLDWPILATCIGTLIKDEMTEIFECSKCGGSGYLPHFAYYADGVCFECIGAGKEIKLKS